MAIVKCPECQGKVSNQAETCPHCGVSLDICPECGELIKYGIETCPHCGTYLSQTYNDENDVYVEDEIDNDEGGSFLGKLLRLVAGIFGWLFEKIALPIISVFIVLAIMIGVFNLCTNAINNAAESEEVRNSSFLAVGKQSTYTFNQGDIIIECTLYKDHSGKVVYKKSSYETNDSHIPCEWKKIQFSNPMSEGGNGEPINALNIECGSSDGFAIDENKNVYLITGYNNYTKFGKATKK